MIRRTQILKQPILVLLALALLATATFAITPPQETDITKNGTAEAISSPALKVAPSLETLEPGSEKAFAHSELQAFFAKHSSDWKVSVDSRNNLPHLIQGKGIPLIPGKGNNLSRQGLKVSHSGELELDDVAGLLRQFMKQNAGLVETSDQELRLDRERSLGFGPNNYLWSVEFQQFHGGVPVEGAFVFFRINHGNIVQLGANRTSSIDLDVTPAVSDREAFELAAAELGLRDDIVQRAHRGKLRIYPVLATHEGLGEFYKGGPGFGYQHRLVWQYEYLTANDHAYRILTDAHSGEILEYIDTTLYASIQGDIYPVTNTDPLVTVDFPFCSVTNSGSKVTDANGQYTYSGGTATSTLSGRYFNMNDNCGSISLSNSTDGNLDFGGSSGTDCSTPGFGGAGNTHSSRSGFYHLTNINRKAESFFTGNSWLNSTVTANMNINLTCNAFWNGSTVNFYRSGGGCANTGELAAVFLHEWGHGMDTNSGGAASDRASGEAVGDTFAFLETRDPCIGENFLSSPCNNCNTSCTGVRDMAAYSIGGLNGPARPSVVEVNSGMNCDRAFNACSSCPCTAYQGIMGYEGHCESYIASGANWDLTQMLIAEYGTEAGWSTMDNIWYGSLTPSKAAYRVASGGLCNPSASVDGCGATNWYTVYLPADDDDGNLANGTPNACRIWDAFDAHGIACGTRPTCSVVCDPQPVADAGADRTINEGDSTTLGTAAQAGHTYSWSPGGATTATINVSPTSTTNYTVTATTSCGSTNDSVTVTVIPAGSNGPQTAVYNAGLGAPACSVAGSSCDSTTLVDGRANNGPEPNQPNTLDGCADGTAGTYHSDESNDRIVVSTLDGGNFSEGDTVQIAATVYAWNTGTADTLDLYYAADANSPTWVFITSLSPAGGGVQTLNAQYTLPNGGQQAVRANFRYQGSAGSCTTGTYDDRDDLVFAVETSSGCTVNADCDNGLFCDGAEACNTGTGLCEASTAVSCEDGVSCTVDSCNEGTDSCDNVATNSLCDNGLFCDGSETCDAALGCQAGTVVSCDDGVSCTVDSCNEGSDSCDNAPDDGACDNGLFCDGSETCNAATGCETGSDPCAGGFCDEVGDICFECNVDADCDDGAFCNGAETCNAGSCQAGSDPCPGQSCDESGDICVVGGACSHNADFSAGAGGWTGDTGSCSTGDFIVGTPDSTAWQVGSGNPGQAFFTANNSGGIGTDDVDGGTCEALSPVVDCAGQAAAEVTLDYYHGQRDAGDDAGDGFTIEVLNNGSVVDTVVSIGDVTNNAAWTSVSSTVTNPGNIQVRVRATDATGGGDIVEAGIDNVTVSPTTAPVPCSTEEDFSGGIGSWTTSGTCSTGTFVAATPTQQTSTVVTQVGGDHTTGTGNALFTATNSSAGNADVDGGVCIVTSPTFSVTDASDLSVWYFHGQRDAGDDAAGDFFQLEISTDGGSTFSNLVSIGDVQNVASWTEATSTVSAGSNVVLRVQVSDGAGPGDIVEGGIDDLAICPQ